MKPTRVVILAKAPVAGLAKTRLAPALGADGAARLAQRMLDHTIETATVAQLGPVELCVTPGAADACWRGLSALRSGVIWSDQEDGDLGARLAGVARRTIEQGENVLLIGTDCPSLERRHLRAAAAALDTRDAAMIPSTDGGYVLLGLARFDDSVFHAIPWSSATVCVDTRARLARLGWSVEVFNAQHDIDEPSDLVCLPADWLYSVRLADASAPSRE